MAAARHNLSRRALLGAGVGACVAFRGRAGAAAGGAARSFPFGLSLSKAASGAAAVRQEEDLRQAQAERVAGDRVGRSAWGGALARFRRAEAALARCRAEQAALPAALRAWPNSQALDEEFGRVDDLRFAALRRLLRVPAPDLAALALKIDLIVDDQAWELTGAELCLERLRADAHRLADAG